MGPLMQSRLSVAHGRITEIWSDSANGSFGSGYLLGGGLILTARHVVMPEGSKAPTVIKARPLGIAHRVAGLQPTDLVWPGFAQLADPHAPDAALLRLRDLPQDLLMLYAAAPHFGRPEDDSGVGGTRVSATGFPAFADKVGGRRDTEEISGVVFLGTRLVAGRYEIKDMTVRDRESLNQALDWHGMSGAALLSGDRVIGVLIARKQNNRYDFSAVRIETLLAIPEFVTAIRGHAVLATDDLISSISSIVISSNADISVHSVNNISRSASEIVRHLLSVPKVIRRIENKLIDLKLIPHKPDKLNSEQVRANNVVQTLFKLRFGDALELLSVVHDSCTTEADDAERRIILEVLYWFLPVGYDLPNSEKLYQYYYEESLPLMEACVATALAAEIRMAAVEERPVKLDRDTLAGKNKVPDLELDVLDAELEKPIETALIQHVGSYLQTKIDPNSSYSFAPEEWIDIINEVIDRYKEFRSGVPYLLFGVSFEKGKIDQLELAKAVKRKFPALANIRLSKDKKINSYEIINLVSLRKILQRV